MIAVLAKPSENAVVREFFQLFKTPWEFYRSGQQYEVLICSQDQKPAAAKLVLIYGAEQRDFDGANGLEIHRARADTVLSYKGNSIPIYGDCATFSGPGAGILLDEASNRSAASEIVSNSMKSIRIGFDLFHEVAHLLIAGQPPAHAAIPALDLHIAFLRDLIVQSSIPLVEIPPFPAGYSFIACLTHDVDHFGVRNHKGDHTMIGFLYRALMGSVINVCRGRQSMKQLAANWLAVFSLPFVHLGLAKDFWCQLNRYLAIEKGLSSTFFVIPRKGDPGQDSPGRSFAKRAARYNLDEIADELRKLRSAGCEIGVHGVDAWCDSAKGCEELRRISRITGDAELGVRMHWLFFDKNSPATLENAGFSYDSTVGYNEVVGYRAGTAQAYKPLDVDRLLELPLHIMDTALFFPTHMNLSPKQARAAIAPLLENATRFGGALTVNWHDRSIAPERLWDDFYVNLLEDLRRAGAWFPTAIQAVAWFRKRRGAVFESVNWDGEAVQVKVSASLNQGDTNLPGLRIRVHKAPAQKTPGLPPAEVGGGLAEVAFNRSGEIRIPL